MTSYAACRKVRKRALVMGVVSGASSAVGRPLPATSLQRHVKLALTACMRVILSRAFKSRAWAGPAARLRVVSR